MSNDAICPATNQPGLKAFTPLTYGLYCALSGISLCLFGEINIYIFTYFKKYRGLYFWSLIVASWGVAIHVLSNYTRWFTTPHYPSVLVTLMGNAGLDMFIGGQSLVLYSRLHLVVRNPNLLRSILIMIVVVMFFFGLPNWIMAWAAHLPKTENEWGPPLNTFEKVQPIVFVLMETIISLVYVWTTVRLIKPNIRLKVRRVMWELIAVNALLVSIDIVWITLFFLNRSIVKIAIQELGYALKLRVEFAVLNQLKGLTSHASESSLNVGRRYRWPQSSSLPSAAAFSNGQERKISEGSTTMKTSPMNAYNGAAPSPAFVRQMHSDRPQALRVKDEATEVAEPLTVSSSQQVSSVVLQRSERSWIHKLWHKIPTGEELPPANHQEAAPTSLVLPEELLDESKENHMV